MGPVDTCIEPDLFVEFTCCKYHRGVDYTPLSPPLALHRGTGRFDPVDVGGSTDFIFSPSRSRVPRSVFPDYKRQGTCGLLACLKHSVVAPYACASEDC